jgi:hypothetical protein
MRSSGSADLGSRSDGDRPYWRRPAEQSDLAGLTPDCRARTDGGALGAGALRRAGQRLTRSAAPLLLLFRLWVPSEEPGESRAGVASALT